MFVTDILTLAKKNKIPKHNIIIAEDCRLKDNWRSSLFSDYKSQRAEERDKNGWQGGPAFEVIVKEVIPSMIKNEGVHHLKHNKIEADDIISQIVIKSLNLNLNLTQSENKSQAMPSKFIIVASDNDYFQILYDNVDLVNMKGVSQKEKMKYSPKGHLIEKILKGDVSDNIKPCMFNKKWNQDLVPSTTKKASVENGLYIKTNKKTIEYYLSKPEQLDADIRNVSCQGEEYVRGYKENKKLIDFNELPQEYVKDVHEMYSKILT
jgi:5'-3' exonuclease